MKYSIESCNHTLTKKRNVLRFYSHFKSDIHVNKINTKKTMLKNAFYKNLVRFGLLTFEGKVFRMMKKLIILRGITVTYSKICLRVHMYIELNININIITNTHINVRTRHSSTSD